MRARALVFLLALFLAGCEDLPIPTSETNPPPVNARADESCMQDCLGEQANEEFCRARCAK